MTFLIGLEAHLARLFAEAQHLVERRIGLGFPQPVDERTDPHGANLALRILDEGHLIAVDAHDQNAAVAQVFQIKAIADPRAQRRDQRLDLFVGQGFVQAGLFDVEDLAAQGQDGLEATIATLFGTATCAVALHYVKF